MSSCFYSIFIILLALFVQGFCAMTEIASLSFNRIRVQYYVSQGNRKAVWLNHLLNHPSHLFGTALIMINLSLEIGSEASRQLYQSLGMNPIYSPITQIIIVSIIGELAPLFAGRRYAESAAMIGAPIIYFLSFILRPIVWMFESCSYIISRYLAPEETPHLLNREEFQQLLEEGKQQLVRKIFFLRHKRAGDLMRPLNETPLIPSSATLSSLRSMQFALEIESIPIYHKEKSNIVAVAHLKDLLRIGETKKIRDYASPPWFISREEPLTSLIRRFFSQKESVAIVLNASGAVSGILFLTDIMDEIFGTNEAMVNYPSMMIDRTFSGDTKISDFNSKYGSHIDNSKGETLEKLINYLLGHPAALGETVRVDCFEMRVKKLSFMGKIELIIVRTVY